MLWTISRVVSKAGVPPASKNFCHHLPKFPIIRTQSHRIKATPVVFILVICKDPISEKAAFRGTRVRT